PAEPRVYPPALIAAKPLPPTRPLASPANWFRLEPVVSVTWAPLRVSNSQRTKDALKWFNTVGDTVVSQFRMALWPWLSPLLPLNTGPKGPIVLVSCV